MSEERTLGNHICCKVSPQFCIHRSNTQTLIQVSLVVECIKNEKAKIWQYYIFHILILLGLLLILRLTVVFFPPNHNYCTKAYCCQMKVFFWGGGGKLDVWGLDWMTKATVPCYLI